MNTKLLLLAFLYFSGACVGLFMLMRQIGGENVPTGYIVAAVFAFAAAMVWIERK